jgi:cellulase/cellobiase CelA1
MVSYSLLHSDTIASIAKLDGLIKETSCTEILGIVIYDLPGRDCAAKASNGELAVGSLSTYKTQYIDRPSFSISHKVTERASSHPQNYCCEPQCRSRTHHRA